MITGRILSLCFKGADSSWFLSEFIIDLYNTCFPGEPKQNKVPFSIDAEGCFGDTLTVRVPSGGIALPTLINTCNVVGWQTIYLQKEALKCEYHTIHVMSYKDVLGMGDGPIFMQTSTFGFWGSSMCDPLR